MIRAARPEDAGEVAALCGQFGYVTSAADAEQRLREFATRADAPVFVDDVDGRVVAWMQLREAATLESGAGVEIIGLVVDERERGAGVGAAMVAFAKGWARERGHARVRVRTNQVRAKTHAFYERLGFTLTKVQRVYDAGTGEG